LISRIFISSVFVTWTINLSFFVWSAMAQIALEFLILEYQKKALAAGVGKPQFRREICIFRQMDGL